MPRLALVMLAVALLAPLAAAQTQPTPGPTASEPAREETPWALSFDKSPLRVRPGGTAVANLTIRNENAHEYLVTIEVRPAAEAPLRAGVKEAQVRLPANASVTVPVQVTAQPGAALGAYTVDVLVHVPASDLRTPRSSTFLPVDVRTTPAPGSQGVMMMEPFPRLMANPGGAAEGNVTVTAFDAGEYALRVESDAGIRVALSRSTLRMAAGDSTVVTVQVLVEDDERVANGSHIIRVIAKRMGDEFAAPATLEIPFEVVRPIRLPAVEASPPPATAEESAAQGVPLLAVGGALAVAGAGASAAGLWWASRRGWAVPLLAPLYTRIAKNRVLDQPTRERIARLVQDEPGITFSELSRRVDVAAGQLTHHARMLEDAGVLFSTRDGQQRRFFHVGHGRVDAVPPMAERALARLQEAGPMSVSDLARALGTSRQALHYHAKKLADEGRVSLDEQGRLVPVVMPRR